MKVLILSTALMLGLATPALANPEGVIANNPASGVNITGCSGTPANAWSLGVTFANTGTIALKAVKVRFSTLDPFDTVLQTDDVTPTGTFSTGAKIEKFYTIGSFHMPAPANVGKMRCSIIGTIAVDGTVWKDPNADKDAKPEKS